MNEYAISATLHDDGLVCLTRFSGTHVESMVLSEALSAAMARRLDEPNAADFAASLWRSCELVPALAAERSTAARIIH